MSAHLSAVQLQFLARLNNGPDGQMLRAILEAKLAIEASNCRTLTRRAELHQAQGRAQQLQEIIDDLSQAKARLEPKAISQRVVRTAMDERSRA